MSEVRVKLADGSERVGRWVTLDEWMAPLDKDHPARKELFVLRSNLGAAMAQIDKLERLNASLHQQFIEEMAKQEQPNENDPPRAVDASPDKGGGEIPAKEHHERPVTHVGRKPKRVLRAASNDAGNAVDETPGPTAPA